MMRKAISSLIIIFSIFIAIALKSEVALANNCPMGYIEKFDMFSGRTDCVCTGRLSVLQNPSPFIRNRKMGRCEVFAHESDKGWVQLVPNGTNVTPSSSVRAVPRLWYDALDPLGTGRLYGTGQLDNVRFIRNKGYLQYQNPSNPGDMYGTTNAATNPTFVIEEAKIVNFAAGEGHLPYTRPAIQFGGGGRKLNASGNILRTGNYGYTLIAVVTGSTTNTTEQIVTLNGTNPYNAPSNRYITLGKKQDLGGAGIPGWYTFFGTQDYNTNSPVRNRPQIVTIAYDPGPACKYSMRIDRVAFGPTNLACTAIAITNFVSTTSHTLGIHEFAGNPSFNGRIHEVMFFDQFLNTTTIEMIESHLVNKWGIDNFVTQFGE